MSIFRRIVRLISKGLLCAVVVFPADMLAANQSRDIRVSATIPARLCLYPNTCDQVVSNKATRLVVAGGTIRYVGSMPLVTTSFDVMTVLF